MVSPPVHFCYTLTFKIFSYLIRLFFLCIFLWYFYMFSVFSYNLGTCTNNRNKCSQFADCKDYSGGYCCHCRPGFYGNGIQCVAEGNIVVLLLLILLLLVLILHLWFWNKTESVCENVWERVWWMCVYGYFLQFPVTFLNVFFMCAYIPRDPS